VKNDASTAALCSAILRRSPRRQNNDTHVERQRRIRQVSAAGALTRLRDANSSTARIRTLPSRILELANSLRHPAPDPSDAVDAREFLVRLSGHTAIQNTLALTLAMISVVGAVGVGAGLTPNATGLAGLPTSPEPQLETVSSDTDRSVAPAWWRGRHRVQLVAPTYPYANRAPLVTGPTIRLAAPRTRAGPNG
jgi:hypothetical protein